MIIPGKVVLVQSRHTIGHHDKWAVEFLVFVHSKVCRADTIVEESTEAGAHIWVTADSMPVSSHFV